jgi:hypothetical protein
MRIHKHHPAELEIVPNEGWRAVASPLCYKHPISRSPFLKQVKHIFVGVTTDFLSAIQFTTHIRDVIFGKWTCHWTDVTDDDMIFLTRMVR